MQVCETTHRIVSLRMRFSQEGIDGIRVYGQKAVSVWQRLLIEAGK